MVSKGQGEERHEPRVGDRVRMREYGAAWNGHRGHSGEQARGVAVHRLPAGKFRVMGAPDTDTVCVGGGWPTMLEPAPTSEPKCGGVQAVQCEIALTRGGDDA